MRNKAPELEFFGKNLEKIRKLKGITQKELAEKIGVTQRVISHYESNVKSPPLKYIILIADVLQVSLDTLVGNKPIKYEFDTRIAKRIKKIETLSERDQKSVWSFINALLVKKKLRKLKKNILSETSNH
ncbi:MAG: helix-turn-helix transcriptional regulator [Spirochaetes bacterium]|nr:helix-turn-helix transcriptional regulator [Spirochaetota bacterium]